MFVPSTSPKPIFFYNVCTGPKVAFNKVIKLSPAEIRGATRREQRAGTMNKSCIAPGCPRRLSFPHGDHPSDQPRPSACPPRACSRKQLPTTKAGGKIRQQPQCSPDLSLQACHLLPLSSELALLTTGFLLLFFHLRSLLQRGGCAGGPRTSDSQAGTHEESAKPGQT